MKNEMTLTSKATDYCEQYIDMLGDDYETVINPYIEIMLYIQNEGFKTEWASIESTYIEFEADYKRSIYVEPFQVKDSDLPFNFNHFEYLVEKGYLEVK